MEKQLELGTKETSTKLLKGNNLDLLKTLEDNSVDSIVTDRPYGIKMMNKRWDHSVPSIEFWQECLRVIKPGGHVLSFGGTRTYHRMAVILRTLALKYVTKYNGFMDVTLRIQSV